MTFLIAAHWLTDKAVALWDWSMAHRRAAAEGLIVVLLVVLGMRYKAKQAELDTAKKSHAVLAAGLLEQITIKNGQISILRKQNGKTVVQNEYHPAESLIVITQKDTDAINTSLAADQAKLATANPVEKVILQHEINKLNADLKSDLVTVSAKEWGFTFHPGFGVELAGHGIQPRLDIKWFYLNRFSLLTGGSTNGLDIAASRHVDDFIPGKPQNVELWMGYKYLRFNNNGSIAGGLRVNF